MPHITIADTSEIGARRRVPIRSHANDPNIPAEAARELNESASLADLAPRRRGFHAVADLAQTLAHAQAVLTAAFPFLAIAGRAAVIGLRLRRPTSVVTGEIAIRIADIPNAAPHRRQRALLSVAVDPAAGRDQCVTLQVRLSAASLITAGGYTLCRGGLRPTRSRDE